MPNWLIAVYLLHIAAALYWLGSSFLVALAKGAGAERQYRFQMIASTVTILVGGFLWGQLHSAGIGKMEVVLGLGGLCSLGAAGIQGAVVGASLRKLRAGRLSEAVARPRMVKGYRWSTVLLAVALLAMVGSYHV
jgi:hypothetical protein